MQIAKENKCAVIMVVHQPPPHYYHSFHTVLLLSNCGRQMYFGPPNLALKRMCNMMPDFLEHTKVYRLVGVVIRSISDFLLEVNCVDITTTQLKLAEQIQ